MAITRSDLAAALRYRDDLLPLLEAVGALMAVAFERGQRGRSYSATVPDDPDALLHAAYRAAVEAQDGAGNMREAAAEAIRRELAGTESDGR